MVSGWFKHITFPVPLFLILYQLISDQASDSRGWGPAGVAGMSNPLLSPHPLPFSPTLPAPATMIVLLDHIYLASTLRLLQLLFHLPKRPGSPVDSSFSFIRGLPSIRVATWETLLILLFEKFPHPVNSLTQHSVHCSIHKLYFSFFTLLLSSLSKKKKIHVQFLCLFLLFPQGQWATQHKWCSVNK